MQSIVSRNFWVVALLVFTLLTLVVYFPVLLGKVPFPNNMVLQFAAWDGVARSDPSQSYSDIGDLVAAFYPFRVFTAKAMSEGTLPLWNPLFLGGVPFLASPQSSLFYPPNVLYYLFSVPTAWALCFMIRLLLSGLFMTLFVRTIGGSKIGSIFAGIVFSLSGFMTAWQGQPMSDAATWLPFVCYAVLRLLNQPSRKSVAIAAFGFAMPVLAGHPETAAHVILVAIAIALFTWVSARLNPEFLSRFTMAGLLALGISAIQVVPTLEWLSQMPSALDIRWPTLAARDALAWVSRDVARTPSSAGLWFPETAAYVGLFTLLAAPVGLFHRNRRHAIFLAALTVIALAAAYGFEPVHWLVNRTPVLGGLKNGRMVFIAAFGVAALAGLGISTLEEGKDLKRRRRAWMLALVTIVFVLTFILIYQLQLATTFKVEFDRRPSFSRTFVFICFIPLVWRLLGGLRGRLFPAAAYALVGFDLLSLAYGHAGFANRDEIFPRSPIFDFLSKDDDPARFRVVSLNQPYSPNANIVYGVESADGYEVRLVPPQLTFASDFIDDSYPGLHITPANVLKWNDRRLDMLNVKYFAIGARSPAFQQLLASNRFSVAFNNGYVALLENKSRLPRAFAVPASGIQVVSETDLQLQTLRDPAFDPLSTVIVSRLSPSLKTHMDRSHARGEVFTNKVEILESGINDVSMKVEVSDPAVLVVSQTHYPGWQASVNGNAAEVFAADVSLTGIALEPGTHDVELAFRPLSVKVGTALSIASALILIASLVSLPRARGNTSRV